MVAVRHRESFWRGKECMRIFCKKAQVQIRLKFIVEILVLWQQGILVSVTEVKSIFYSCKPVFVLFCFVFFSGTQALRVFVL